MNILYLEHYAGSSEMGMEFRPYYLAQEWIKMGHTVTIIAGDYSHLRRKNPTVYIDFQTEIIGGIEFVWLKTGKYEGNGIQRALTMGRFVWKLLSHAKKIANKWNPDIVIASSTYPLDTYPAQRIAKIANAIYVHEVHDMWPATLYEVGGMSKKHPFVVIMQIAENSAYKHCDKCVSLLPYAKEYMIEHGLASEKFINIPNGIVIDEWENADNIPEEHKMFFDSHHNKFIVGYFGGHSISNALDLALDVAKEYMEKDKEVIFVFVGDGVEKSRLIERAKSEKINNVFFLPPVSKQSIPNLLKYFNCSYMTGLPSPLYKYGLCLNKMYDSMMAGIPIVCAFDAPKTLVSVFHCGIECNPQSTVEVVKAIDKIKSMSQKERNIMGKNGSDAILQNYTYERLAEQFLDELCKLGGY